MKRTALSRKTPLRRTGPIKRKARKPKPHDDAAYLAWVRTLDCLLAPFGCFGAVHPHHAIHRSQGGTDRDAVPLCFKHHIADWHGHAGEFRGLSRLERFAWAQQAIGATQKLYEGRT